MAFTASQKDINEILSRNIIYTIPKNQRKYVWGENEWYELFEDLFVIEQNKTYSHFLGSFVLSKTKGKNRYSIIDGQQRLLTLSLLFSAIINALNYLGEKDVALSFIGTFLITNNNGEYCYKVERDDGAFYLTDLIDKIEKGYIDSNNAKIILQDNYGVKDKYNKQLCDCFVYLNNKVIDFIENKTKKKETLISLKERIVNSSIIEILVESDVDGYKVFETLNARGIPLDQHELIKNYLYSYMRKTAQIKKLDNLWQKMINNLIHEDVDYINPFITHYCIHVFGKVKKNDEYKTIRSNTDKKEVEELLVSLHKNSLYYSYLINPEKYKENKLYNENVYISLNYFKTMNIRQVRPLLLSLFEKLENGDIQNNDFVNCINLLETFYFIYLSVLKNTTNIIDNSIANLSKIIHIGTMDNYSNLIKRELSKYISDKDKIEKEFSYISFSNKKNRSSISKRTVSYVFSKFEHFYDNNDELSAKINSIEHILNDSTDLDYSAYIGNLLPLSTKLNGKSGDKNFKEKLEFYKKSNLLTVKKFVDEYSKMEQWDKTCIEERGKKLAKEAFSKIWIF